MALPAGATIRVTRLSSLPRQSTVTDLVLSYIEANLNSSPAFTFCVCPDTSVAPATPFRIAVETRKGEEASPIAAGEPLSDYAAARCLARLAASAGGPFASLLQGSGGSVENVEAAVDVCEQWAAFYVTEGRGKKVDAPAEQSGLAACGDYFARLFASSSSSFLFDGAQPSLADMALFALAAQSAAQAALSSGLRSAGEAALKRFACWSAAMTKAIPGAGAASAAVSGGCSGCAKGKGDKASQGGRGGAEGAQSADGPDATGSVNFLKQIVEDDLRTGKHKTIVTRFPPEPNGFLHLGHAKSVCVNFGLAKAFGGRCHLRFDDTNPMKEEMRYIESIQRDVRWLGGDWGSHLYYASDYFEQLYEWAELLIKKGLAFVDDDSLEDIRRKRGSITQPGENSSFRDRSIQENLDLFRRMRAGEFEEGARVLRAKIDMAHSNMNMRDPILYRILKKEHPRTGDKWVIYPMYDYAHGQSDSIENISHSICTLEFELHRPLYDWFQEKLEIKRTRQIEFARLNVTYTVMSKRKLLALVNENWVQGWDDPRLPTLSGLRRRGVPPSALRDFCEKVGVARRESTIKVEVLEKCIRDALHPVAHRRFAIQDPIAVTITNFEGKDEVLTAANHPEDESFGTRELHFGRKLYIDREDFMENPPVGYHRLAPGAEVRLKHAYWIKCTDVVKDASGRVTELLCTYDQQTKNCSAAPDGRKVKGTIHWLAETDAVPAEIRIFGRLFNKSNPDEEDESKPEASWRDNINKESLKVYKGFVEKSATDPKLFPPQSSLQFERLGFFTPDASTFPEVAEKAETPDVPVFNLTVSLQEGFTATEDSEKDKAKQQDKLAREKAALERQKKKEEKEARRKLKEQQKA
ncbi:glutaminyl-tRNA synthetase (GlnRS) [Besnoitia besnoiti]|uniref:glutamine--tRNA ligase n=1 Tax=Besnoitia besnoiti TaxID=94643 RepID=A0A2A9MM24_BESBE|nr:glutaminyl-tRNA synthetase (GlnRS) [Besnoitia besnoiti]PFH37431.1 glutaminyl-tRNA synthetase (GlnRS) [Besnoitia besnoiti]